MEISVLREGRLRKRPPFNVSYARTTTHPGDLKRTIGGSLDLRILHYAERDDGFMHRLAQAARVTPAPRGAPKRAVMHQFRHLPPWAGDPAVSTRRAVLSAASRPPPPLADLANDSSHLAAMARTDAMRSSLRPESRASMAARASATSPTGRTSPTRGGGWGGGDSAFLGRLGTTMSAAGGHSRAPTRPASPQRGAEWGHRGEWEDAAQQLRSQAYPTSMGRWKGRSTCGLRCGSRCNRMGNRVT